MPFNFPEPLPRSTGTFSSLKYPLNLTADNRKYYTSIDFITYKPAFGSGVINSISSNLSALGVAAIKGVSVKIPIPAFLKRDSPGSYGVASGSGIILPIPQRLNDTNVMQWSTISLTNTVMGLASGAAGAFEGRAGAAAAGAAAASLKVGSAFTGLQFNPFILQYFNQPEFRTFNFTWTLAPRNNQESEAINNIVYQLKARQAPTQVAGGFLMGYPDLAVLRFHPSDGYELKLKECVIKAVSVDYTPAGPSFFNGTSAPSMVSLSLSLMETKFWWSEEWTAKKSTDTPSVPGDTPSVPGLPTNPDAPEGP
jgi:hypothetical protein